MFISLAQRKGTKETSTPPRPPLKWRMQPRQGIDAHLIKVSRTIKEPACILYEKII